MDQSKETRVLEQWVKEYERDPECIAEGLAMEIIEDVLHILQDSGLSQAWLAREMGVSRARMSRILSAPPDLTLASIARLAVALGVRSKIHFVAGASKLE